MAIPSNFFYYYYFFLSSIRVGPKTETGVIGRAVHRIRFLLSTSLWIWSERYWP